MSGERETGTRGASGVGALQPLPVRTRVGAGKILAATAVVVAVATGMVTNLVTGQRGWGLVAGVAALTVLTGCGALLAWRLQSTEDDRGDSATMTDGPRPGLGSIAPPWGLLPTRVRGRDSLIADLSELAARPDGRVHLLSGLGGNGKTTIALAVARNVKQAGGQVWWLSARDRFSIDSGLLDLAGALGVTTVELEQARAGSRSLLELVWERLTAVGRPWLLVVDNADSPELLAADGGRTRDGTGVARPSERGLTLVTSRNSDRQVWGENVVIHAVDPLQAEDGAEVLLDLSGPSAGTVREATVLALRLGCLPLALRTAGHYLSSPMAKLDEVTTFEVYRAGLDARFADLQGSLGSDGDSRDIVMTTWETSLDLLAARGHPDARPFMRLIGQFAPAPIPVEILNPATLSASTLFSAASRWPGWLQVRRDRPHFGKHELNQVIAALTSLALLDMTDYVSAPRTGIRLPCPSAIACLIAHPLVVEVNAQVLRREKEIQQAAVTTIVELVSAAAERADPRSPARAATWPLLAPHVELLAASVPSLSADDAARFAAAANRTAMGLRHGGDYSAALHCLTRARGAVGQLAPDDPVVLALRHSYAYVIDDLGRFEEAEAEYRSILAARIKSLGARGPLTLATRNHLAYALSQQRRFTEAEAEYRQVLQARQELLGPADPDTLTTQNNLADVLYGQQRYDEAANHYQQVLRARLQTLGPDHPRTLTTRNNLARNRDRQGEHQEAEKELRAILSVRRDSRGADHPSTLATRYDIATSLASQERLSEAREEFEEVLTARQRVLGENHPDTLAAVAALKKVIYQETSATQGSE
jgi:tetratricopeptide (TPR) repeat protein